MNSVKLLRVASRVALRRNVSSIRVVPESVAYNGKTYTKMLYPHSQIARVVNFDWKTYWERHVFFRCVIYSASVVLPLAVYVHFKVYLKIKESQKNKPKDAHGH